MILSDEKQNEIFELANVFYDEKLPKLCFQSIGTFNSDWGYKEEVPGTHYLLEDIIELAIETFREELEYDMAHSKHFRQLLVLQREMKKLGDELNKK
jgi:hypothetical protein